MGGDVDAWEDGEDVRWLGRQHGQQTGSTLGKGRPRNFTYGQIYEDGRLNKRRAEAVTRGAGIGQRGRTVT